MYKLIAKYTIILSVIPAIYYSIYPGKIVLITILCSYPLLICSFWLSNIRQSIYINGKRVILFFCLVNLLILIRGLFNADSLKDWTILLSSVVINTLFLPYIIYLGAIKSTLKVALRTFFYWGIILVCILYFTTDDSGPLGFTRSISPLCLFMLFLPYLNFKYKVVIFIISIISLISDISIRTNLLNISFAYLLALTFYIRKLRTTVKVLKLSRTFLLVSPLVFLLLGASGVFNVFKYFENIVEFTISDNSNKTQEMFVDSRTAIYMDVFGQLIRDEALIWGLGGNGRVKTALVQNEQFDYDKLWKDGRPSSESGMLNFIQWSGLLGLISYFMLFLYASYLALYKSKNWLCIMLGVWVSYKGLISFIEDPVIFNPASIFIMIAIGMCFNYKLRQMNDREIRLYLSTIFSIKNIKSLR